MTWDSGAWDSGTWDSGPALESGYFQTKQHKPQKHMKRQNYYPSRLADQVPWLITFANGMPLQGPICHVIPADVTAAVADAKWASYVLSSWLSEVRAFSPSATEAVDEVLTGSGASTIVMPGFNPPPPVDPAVVPQKPGVLNRIFALVAKMKNDAGYSAIVGETLGIIGPEDTASHATPKFSATPQQGSGTGAVKITFFKYGHMGVYIESRRGTGAWEFLAIDTESPYVDERPLLVAGQPEQREYRMRFWDKGTPNGDWTDVQKVTVSP
jgi:hypothetical protein